jgi:hypothetical protein
VRDAFVFRHPILNPNRRVEDDMRPLVKSAVQLSNTVVRNARKAEMEAKAKRRLKNKPKAESEEEEEDRTKRKKPAPASPITDKHANGQKEFQKVSSSAPRRLNDIAQAPPEFKKLPRGAVAASERSSNGTGVSKREGILSMAQKSMMEKEREKAIARYREMKANRRKAGEGGDERDRDGVDDD